MELKLDKTTKILLGAIELLIACFVSYAYAGVEQYRENMKSNPSKYVINNNTIPSDDIKLLTRCMVVASLGEELATAKKKTLKNLKHGS